MIWSLQPQRIIYDDARKQRVTNKHTPKKSPRNPIKQARDWEIKNQLLTVKTPPQNTPKNHKNMSVYYHAVLSSLVWAYFLLFFHETKTQR